MKYAVIDASYYPSTQLGVAAQIVRDLLGESYDRDSKNVLVSSVHPLQNVIIEKIKRKNDTVIVGGPGALSPGAYESADVVCVGDCCAFIEALKKGKEQECSNAYTPSSPAPVDIDNGFPYFASGKYKGEDGRVAVFCSRGCKHRCAFCQTGWSCLFSEHPDPAQIIGLPNGKYNYVSNALSDVSFCKLLPGDISASHTLREAVNSNTTGRLVRVGVEGVSERLRSAVGKPISNQNLIDWTLQLNERGIAVRWFMIAGLPYESWDDWLELIDNVKAYVALWERGTLQISFTAYVPEPATPIAELPYSNEYELHHAQFREWYFSQARINHLSLFRPQGAENRKKKAEAQMHPNNKLVRYPHRDKIAASVNCYLKNMGLL